MQYDADRLQDGYIEGSKSAFGAWMESREVQN